MKFEQLQNWLHRAAGSRFAPLVLMGISVFDFLFMILPSDACLAAAILGRPKRTRIFVVSMALGRVIAVGIMAAVMTQVPLEWLHGKALSWGMEDSWKWCLSFFERFGWMALGMTALTPFPLQFITAISAVSGVALPVMAVSMGIGSLIRYSIVAALALGGRFFYGKVQGRPPHSQSSKSSAHPKNST